MLENWGTSPLLEHVKSWYWGHGRLGPYSIVWYDGITLDDDEYVSAYVAKDGEIVYSHNSSITVRPTGTNTNFPPRIGDVPTGYAIKIDMGHIGVIEIDVAATVVFQEEGSYARWVGRMAGGIRGQQNYTGAALLEQYAFTTA